MGAVGANTQLIAELALLRFLISGALVVYMVRTQRKVEAAETSIKCQGRYKQLLDTRSSIANMDDAERYFDRFWGVQPDQFIRSAFS